MAFKLKINSTDVTAYVVVESVQVSLRQNERGTASFTMIPGHTCTSFDHVEIFELDGTTRKFDGIVFPGPTTRGIERGNASYFQDVACVDYVAYLDWITWSRTYTAPYTLADLLNDAVTDVLGAFGFTVDGAQDTGDTFQAGAGDQAVVIDNASVMEVFRSHFDQCDPPRVLRLKQSARSIRAMLPGADSAPFAISDSDPNCVSFEWSYPDFTPATRVALRCGQPGEWEITQTFTADGVATSWPIGTHVSRLPGTPTPDVPDPRIKISVNGGALDWVGVVGSPYHNNFDMDYSTGPGDADELVAVAYGTPPAGTTLAITFAIQGPFSVEAKTGSPPYLTQVFTMEDQLPNIEPYLLRAQNELDKLQGAARQVTVEQLTEPGTASAQLMTSQKIPSVVLSSRVFSNDMVITQLDFILTEIQSKSTRFSPSTQTFTWHTTITAMETLNKHYTLYDQVRQLLKGVGGGGSFSLATGGGGGGGTTPGVTLSCLHLGGSNSEACSGITWADPAAPGSTVGPYPDDPISSDAREIPNAVIVDRGNVDGPPFPIIQFLPFSCKVTSNQTGYVKIGIVDMDSDYGHPIYIYSYLLAVVADVPTFKAGIFEPLSSTGLVLQNDHRYVMMFEGAHP